jgi:hypothetical protein
MTLPSSGQLSLRGIRNEFAGPNDNLSTYYRGRGYTTTNNGSVPTSGSITIGQFHGAYRVIPGTWDQGTPGYYEIWLPPRQWLRVRVWGAGGGGGVGPGELGGAGGQSDCLGAIGYGGGAGGGNYGGAGGGAGGGNSENLAGEGGTGSYGGGSPYGGGRNSAWPGGAGAGNGGYGGGGGGFAHLEYGPDQSGYTIGIHVGAGGAGAHSTAFGVTAAAGASGRVLIEWG